jgi:hypothetical protein
MSADQASPTPDEPSVAGVRVRPVLPVVLYVLLVGSALLAFWAQRSATAPEPVSRFAPWAFLAFALGFAAYRLALVAAKRYSAFKAFSQIGVAAMFFMLLLLPHVAPPEETLRGLPSLLRDRDPSVRALAAELVGHRQSTSEASGLIELLSDPSLAVRASARQALTRLNGGVDLGDEGSKWKERFP